jgi:hypothetical protein
MSPIANLNSSFSLEQNQPGMVPGYGLLSSIWNQLKSERTSKKRIAAAHCRCWFLIGKSILSKTSSAQAVILDELGGAIFLMSLKIKQLSQDAFLLFVAIISLRRIMPLFGVTVVLRHILYGSGGSLDDFVQFSAV